MRRVRFSQDALTRLREIARWTVRQFGRAQATVYRDRLVRRIDALAAGNPPHARPCEALMDGNPKAKGLRYVREGSHFIILRETPDRLDIVDFIHYRRDLDRILQRILANESNGAGRKG